MANFHVHSKSFLLFLSNVLLCNVMQGCSLVVAWSPGVPYLGEWVTNFLNKLPKWVPSLSQGDSS